jgi:chain length determinant protein (polysaccharide antigen chain regulator)
MEETIDLRELVTILAKGKVLIAAVTAVAIIIGAIASYLIMDPVYSTNATVSLNNSTDVNEKNSYINKVISPALYTERAKAPEVIQEAINKSGVKGYTVESIQSNLTVEQMPDTNLFHLTLKAPNSAEATKILGSLIAVVKKTLSSELLDLTNEDKDQNAAQMKIEKENLSAILKQYQQKVTTLGLPTSILMNNVIPGGNQYLINLDDTSSKALSSISSEEFSELNELSKKIETQETVYQEYLTKERQLNALTKMFQKETKIVSTVSLPIEQENPVSPKPVMNMAIALVIGLMTGVGIVFLRNYWKELK